MLYEDPRGEKFISDPGYVADATPYVVSSELPCPSCLTGLLQVEDIGWTASWSLIGALESRFDGFKCQSCERRVLIERRAA